FFVLSGYLITAMIREEMAAGRFRLTHFYVRRMRRIFPALFLMMAVAIVAGYGLLMPLDFARLSGSACAAALFPFHLFFKKETGYFAPLAEFQPLLHTWSLAIEEQFYLLYPLLLVVLGRMRPGRLFAILALLALFSFGFSIHALARGSSDAFYLAPY